MFPLVSLLEEEVPNAHIRCGLLVIKSDDEEQHTSSELEL